MQEEPGRLKEATPSYFLALFLPFLIASSIMRENISECSFLSLRRSVYMPSVEVQECPVFAVKRSRTYRHTDRNFSKPFTVTLLGGGSNITAPVYSVSPGLYVYYFKQKV